MTEVVFLLCVRVDLFEVVLLEVVLLEAFACVDVPDFFDPQQRAPLFLGVAVFFVLAIFLPL